ncbi:hypothetical protein SSABA_v1c01840 [Spiroplasma sabaudiense Ar-1343]|uniref:DUF1700 domain-containing protein n=1 Tax=Spiroplasma sabaudiense Ar-1343 TaxID=1276257 RepID=W6A9D7_9MOLU|nr:DUF1700 domain-containing protein [Spiroplasma sabaudiense]AHI53596.1 hypothetical protein SSABA_v1c01840 [Spiroplasma sabaudiense Ar-1343]
MTKNNPEQNEKAKKDKAKIKKEQWLKKLEKSLLLLEKSDRDDIINSYSEKINIELAEGSQINDILESLEPVSTISENVYQEFNIDTNSVKNDEKSTAEKIWKNTWVTFLNIFTMILGVFLPMMLALTFLLAIIGILVAFIPFIVFAFINYDFIKVLPLVMTGVGGIPLLAIVLWFMTVGCYRLGIISTNGLFASYDSQRRVSRIAIPFKRRAKIALLISAALLTGVGGGGAIWTFSGENSIGGAMIADKYFYQTSTALDLSDQQITSDHHLSYSNFQIEGLPSNNGLNKDISDNRLVGNEPIQNIVVNFSHSWRESNIGNLAIELLEFNMGKPVFKISLDYYNWTLAIVSLGSPLLEIKIN